MLKNSASREGGFTLVELMIVVAITAILAAVAVPGYLNHINRVRQSEGTGSLLTARLEMEEFLADNGRYAGTIGCLPSFLSNAACLSDCGNASCLNSARLQFYSFSVEAVNGGTYYRIASTRKIYSYAPTDRIFVSSGTNVPVVTNEGALKFSVFKALFD